MHTCFLTNFFFVAFFGFMVYGAWRSTIIDYGSVNGSIIEPDLCWNFTFAYENEKWGYWHVLEKLLPCSDACVRFFLLFVCFCFWFFFWVLSQSFWFSSQIFEFQVGISKFWVNVSEFLDDISKFRAKFSNIESKFQNSKSKFCYSESITYFKIPSRMFTFIRVKISKFRI